MNIDRIINSLPIANLDETSTGFRPTVSYEMEFIAYKNGQILKSRDLDLIQSLFGDYARENDIKTDASAAYNYQTKGRMFEFNGFPSPICPSYIEYMRSLLKTFKDNCRANNIKIKVNTDNTGLHCHLKLLCQIHHFLLFLLLLLLFFFVNYLPILILYFAIFLLKFQEMGA